MEILKKGETCWYFLVTNLCPSCSTVYILKPGDRFDELKGLQTIDYKPKEQQ